MTKAIVLFMSALAIASCASVDRTETGKINSIDKGDRLVTIDDDRYWIDDDVSISDLHKGDRVIFTIKGHQHKHGYRIITDIDED